MAFKIRILKRARVVVPADLPREYRATWVPAERWGAAGLDLDERTQRERLKRWGREHVALFTSLRGDPRINTEHLGRDYLDNGWYPTPDAEIYAAMIVELRPARIVEIGGGYSTLVARHVVDRLGLDTRIVVVDPEPRTGIRDAADDVLPSRVEELRRDQLRVVAGSILFIDSSHVMKAGGDVPHLYTRVIPELPAGAVVHVHDVFLPYDYPPRAKELLWTEQYLLHALLAHSPRYRVLFAAQFMAHEQPELMASVVGRLPQPRGGAFWFRVES